MSAPDLSPHSILIQYLGQLETLESVIVIGISKPVSPDEDKRITVACSRMPDHEAIGALYAAASIRQIEFEEKEWNKFDKDENGDQDEESDDNKI